MKKIQANDFTQYTFLSRLRYSPDGSAAAFTASRALDGDRYETNIWLYDKTRGASPLTSSGREGIFTFEDDSTLLFLSGRKADGEKDTAEAIFYRISTRGGEAQKAFSLPVKPKWIEKIGADAYLLLANAEMDRTDFSPKPGKGEKDTAWEADCHVLRELPFWQNGQGFTDGKRTRLFLYTAGESPSLEPITPVQMDVSQALYDAEKRWVYFIGDNFVRLDGMTNAVYRCELSGGGFTRLTPEGFVINHADLYSGSIVLSAADRREYGPGRNPAIYLLDPAQPEPQILYAPDRSIGGAVGTDSAMGGGTAFKVYGDWLYYTSVMDYSGHLCRLPLAGGEPEVLSPVGDSFACFDVSQGGLLAIAFRGQSLQELYTLRENQWKPVTHFHDAFHAEHLLSEPARFAYTDPEGFEIDGFVMPPTGLEEGKRYPAILHIHGGPRATFGTIFHHEMQLWAAKGYFVLYCNPRGSDGKGDAFADIRGKWGKCDYQNIMQLLDEALALYPAIDASRVGVTGGSYGGFMTNWIIGHTDRFRAAATQRSISNWASKLYISDIGYYHNVDQILAEPWQTSTRDAQTLWDFSPLKYVENVKTPTLIIHSDEDYRCPAPEGYQLYTALQLHGVETRMCVFHGENHELSRSGKPKNRLRRLEEISGWMDAHLQTETKQEDQPL